MTKSRFQRAKEIFLQAYELPAQERGEFLDRSCDGDSDLRAHVQRLLEADTRSRDTFVDGIFLQAFGRPEAERPAFLDEMCSADPEVRRQVERRLRERVGDERSAPDGTLPVEGRTSRSDPTTQIERIRSLASSPERYQVRGRIGRGGQGAVYEVWDEELARRLAMKVILGKEDAASPTDTPPADPETLSRFLEEAQVTGQLDHPCVVPVHELGLDPDGQVYFTMRLVRGDDFSETIRKVNAGEGGWTQVHDLAQNRPPRITGGRARFPLVTMDGRVMGTPSYMPPEQAMGQIEAMGPASDVYSMGAVLYQLLTGRVPYVPPVGRITAHTILAAVVKGPPEPVSGLAPDAPAELVAICERAMAREVADRYPDMTALATDLRAFLEGRVVGAFESGAWAELRKWVGRNRGWAATGAAALVLLLVAFGWAIAEKSNATEHARVAEARVKFLDGALLVFLENRARSMWPAWPEQCGQYRSWIKEAERLLERLPQHEASLAEIRPRALPRSPEETDATWQHQELAELVTGLRAFGAEGGLLEDVRERLEWALQVEELTLTSPEAAAEWTSAVASIANRDECPLYDGLELKPQLGLVPLDRNRRTGLWEFWHPRTGKRPEPNPDRDPDTPGKCNRWVITEETGLVFVLIPGGTFRMGAEPPKIGAGTEQTPEGLRVTSVAEDSLAARAEIEVGDRILAVNGKPTSTKDELTAALPTLRAGEKTMFVVMRGDQERTREATVEIGVGSPNVDPGATSDEKPIHEVTLRPYFLSKYELTQGQWYRFVGKNPSHHAPDSKVDGKQPTLAHPVEQVSWDDCRGVLDHLGLDFPKESWWEYAARARTTGIWWTGSQVESLQGAANLADRVAQDNRDSEDGTHQAEPDDGYWYHAPVGTHLPNGFGIHDVHGNVFEWCLDRYDGAYGNLPQDGEREPVASKRMLRGGAFHFPAAYARSSDRGGFPPEIRLEYLGVRPAREIH